ncbi:MAG: response regulator, partial [Bacteroidota bacterium]
MKKPIIFVLDDDPAVIRAVVRDLRNAYKKAYRILATESANEALKFLKDLKNKGDHVALFLSDQRMPEMLGVDFLEKAKQLFPEAKRILLTAYSDTEAAIQAINEVQLDYYLMKPWNPPEEKLYPVLNDQLEEWQVTFKPDFAGIKIVGYQWSPKSHTIKDFLSGNLIPYQWMDIETSEKGSELLKINDIAEKDLPAVFFTDGSNLVNPTLTEVAANVGMIAIAQQKMYDVAIIGAGPAGLAAGVYGGSEGVNTLLVE